MSGRTWPDSLEWSRSATATVKLPETLRLLRETLEDRQPTADLVGDASLGSLCSTSVLQAEQALAGNHLSFNATMEVQL